MFLPTVNLRPRKAHSRFSTAVKKALEILRAAVR